MDERLGHLARYFMGCRHKYVAPDRICGGLIIGELSKGSHHGDSFKTCGITVTAT